MCHGLGRLGFPRQGNTRLYWETWLWTTLTLPLDYQAIERILPHRYPFLLVDRITEFDVDKRIVGVKNVSLNERHLTVDGDGSAVLPPTILTEAVAQVGAILILAKPENREKLIFFMGIERVRYRRPVYPGDQVVIEAKVQRLRSRMGVLKGVATVDGKVVVEGTMTFALGPASAAATPATAPASSSPSPSSARPSRRVALRCARAAVSADRTHARAQPYSRLIVVRPRSPEHGAKTHAFNELQGRAAPARAVAFALH